MKFMLTALPLGLAFLLGACSDDDSPSATETGGEADLVVVTRIDDTTGFINRIDSSEAGTTTNANGAEINPAHNVYKYGDAFFTTGGLVSDRVARYVDNEGVLTETASMNAGPGSYPSSMIFVDDTKAYITLSATGKVLVVEPDTLAVTGELDLSAYAIDANGQTGGEDLNPEPSAGIVRDGKLYLALFQIDTFQTFQCRGKASVLVIDVNTDAVLNHTTDDRTCSTGRPVRNLGVHMDEQGDIYFNNLAGFGYYPGFNSGILRIRSGEDNFDPNYYFSITDLTDLPDGPASVFISGHYYGEGKLYVSMTFPALASNPPDFANDRNQRIVELDLYNQQATVVELPPTNPWTAGMVKMGEQMMMGLSTTVGDGLFRYTPATGEADASPYIITEGMPVRLLPN